MTDSHRSTLRTGRRVTSCDQVEVTHDEESGVVTVVIAPCERPFALDWRRVLRGVATLALILLLLPLVFALAGALRGLVYSQPLLAPLRPAMAWLEGSLLLLLGLLAFIHPLALLHKLLMLGWHLATSAAIALRNRRDRTRSGDSLQAALDEAYADAGVTPAADEEEDAQ